MRPGTRILYSLCLRIAVLAARSAAEDTGNQPGLGGISRAEPLAGYPVTETPRTATLKA